MGPTHRSPHPIPHVHTRMGSSPPTQTERSKYLESTPMIASVPCHPNTASLSGNRSRVYYSAATVGWWGCTKGRCPAIGEQEGGESDLSRRLVVCGKTAVGRSVGIRANRTAFSKRKPVTQKGCQPSKSNSCQILRFDPTSSPGPTARILNKRCPNDMRNTTLMTDPSSFS